MTSSCDDETQDFPRESWVFVARKVSSNAYLISTGGEVSLVDFSHLVQEIGNLLKGQQP